MHTLDKQGIRLEQCANCRGIFLDHGELEQILQAEQRFYGGGVPAYGAPHGGHRDSPRPYRQHSDSPRPYRDSPRPYGGQHHSDSPRPYGHQKRGRGSFLGDLFG